MNATTGDQQDPIGPEPAQPPPELATEPSTELATELPTEPPTEPPTESPKEASAEPEPAASPAASAGLEPEDDLASHRFECRSCGFVYDPQEGVKKVGIAAGTPFLELDAASFRCPVCRSKVGAFKDIGPRNKPSGFEENLNFGLGVNQLTPGQKNVLIFGGFALAIAFFLSLYSLR
jgi:rubredoxin